MDFCVSSVLSRLPHATIYSTYAILLVNDVTAQLRAGWYSAVVCMGIDTAQYDVCLSKRWYGMVWYGMVWYGMVCVQYVAVAQSMTSMLTDLGDETTLRYQEQRFTNSEGD
jgi:hypothetical protein